MALAAYLRSNGFASGEGATSKPQKTSPIKGRPTNPKDALLHWCYMKTKSYVSRLVELSSIKNYHYFKC